MGDRSRRGTRPGQVHRFPRVKSFSWNVGGLSVAKLDFLLEWFLQEKIQVAMLQETRWNIESEWASRPFVLIHSGGTDKDKYCGVLTIINTSLVNARSVRHATILPGRILQVRLSHPKTSQHIDIINGYQFFLGSSSVAEERAPKQQLFLDKLDQTLAGLPRRNVLILGGDFNMGLPRTSPWIGSCCNTDSMQMTAEQEQFLQIVTRFGLCAINSWGPMNAYTCTGPVGGQSFIDFVFLRQEHADLEAKRTKIQYTHPLLSGHVAYHCPMLFSWSLAWLPWKKSFIKPSTCRLQLSSASTIQQVQCERALAQALEKVGDLELLPGVVRTEVGRYHQAPTLASSKAVWQESCFKQRSLHVWQLWRQLSSLSGCSVKAILKRWLLFTMLMHAKRRMHKQSRRRRKERLHYLFCRARDAVTKGDRRELHKLVRLLSPRAPRKILRLRHSDGRLMDVEEELANLQQHLQQQFASSPSSLCVGSRSLVHMPFTSDEVVGALRQLSNHKAVPLDYLPTEFWRRYAKPIGERIWQLLSQSWKYSVSVPLCWSASWITLIPKPHKGQDQLSGWRPISLQDPCGKAILSLLTSKAKQQTLADLVRDPQFAYLPGRSTGDALRRVSVHVACAQHYHSQAVRNLYELRAGNHRLSLGGGMQLFLDVEHAFDAVPRHLLQEAMNRQNLDWELIHLFLCWYARTDYHLRHHDCTVSIQATTGIRQGCVAAPLLWDYHTSNIMKHLQDTLGSSWVRDVLTLFADDFHLQWLVQKESDFLAACDQMSIFLRILDKLKVKVCHEKSALMMMLDGSSHRSLVAKRFLRRNGQLFFKVRLGKEAEQFGQILIPIVRSQKYLGVVVSYRKMQSLTLGLRIKHSWATFHKLRKWWQPSALPLHRRIELWKVIVWPTLCYGLCEVGLSTMCENRLHSVVMRQLRIIARSPLHITKESNEKLLRRLSLGYPLDMILLQASQQLVKWLERLSSLSADDIIVDGWNKVCSMLELASKPHSQSLRRWLARVCLWLQHVQTNSTLLLFPLPPLLKKYDSRKLMEKLRIPEKKDVSSSVNVAVMGNSQTEYRCSICDRVFAHRMALRKHQWQEHDLRTTCGPKFDLGRDMDDGMPRCRHCGWTFLRRQGLQLHIERNACPILS